MDCWNQLLFTGYEVGIAVNRVHRSWNMRAMAPANTTLKFKSADMCKTNGVTLILEQRLKIITRAQSSGKLKV